MSTSRQGPSEDLDEKAALRARVVELERENDLLKQAQPAHTEGGDDLQTSPRDGTPELGYFQHLYTTAPIGLCCLDTKLRYVFVNAWLAAINGLSVEEHLGRSISEVLPEVATGVEAQLRHVLETGEPVVEGTVEAETAAQPGVKKCFEHHYDAVRSADGIIVGVSCVVQDITDRKQAEESLRESEGRMRALLEGAFEGIIISDKGTILEANQAFADMYGYALEEVIGLSPVEMTTPESAAKIADRIALGDEKPYDFVGLKRDGTPFDIEVVGKKCTYRGRDVRITAMRDITEWKREVGALQESEERFRRVVSNISDALIVDNEEGRIIYANDRFLDMFGFAREDLPLLGLDDYVAPRWRERLGGYHDRRVRGEEAPERFEYEGRRKDGSSLWLEVCVTQIMHSGEIVGTQSLIRDISERKRAEEALQDSEELFRTTFESAAIAMALDDEQGRLIETNSAFQKMFGYSAQELEGMAFSKLTHPEDIDRGWDLFKELVQDKRDSFHLRKRYYRKDGTLLWGSVNVSAIRNMDGSFCHTVAMIQDITARKLAEDALRFTQFAVDHNSNATYWVRSDGRISYVNHAACQALGYSYQELTSMRVPEIDPDFPGEKWGAHFLEIKEAGSMTFEAHHRTKSGRLFPVEILTNYLAYDDQEYLCAYVRDITERKRAEEVLRESESKYRELFESASDVICLVDGEGNIVDINRRGELLTGYSRAELRQMNLLRELVVPEDRDLPRRLLECAAPGEEQVYEIRWRTKDGRTIHLEGASTFRFSPTGEFLSTRCTLRDITERKRVEAERERLMSAIEQARETIIITDVDAVIKYVNPAFERITGYSRAEAVGKNPNIVKSGRHDAGFYKEMWDTLARGDTWTGEIINKKKDGTLYTEETTISPVFDAAGKTVNYVAVKHDITERKRAEEQTRQLQADLAHMSRLSSMGEMATGLAHELNQPLTAITNYALGCVRRLKSNAISQDELENILSRIASQARRSGSIIRGLETLVRKSSALRTDIDVNESIMDVAELVDAEAAQHHAKARFELEPNLPLVLADQTQLQQVILNLVQNGCEAIQDMPESRRAVTVRTKQRGDTELEVSVSDNGRGIPEPLGERLFEPFFTTKAQGIGMGLAISRSIVESHGGRLWATPNRGEGTTFHFTLPIVGGHGGDE